MTDNVTLTTPNPTGCYVEWAPIFAGAVVTLAVSFVLLAFGSAVGLSVVSPWGTAPIPTRVVWGGVFWMLLVVLWSFAVGGYIAGRMRHRWKDALEDEVHFRDGAHGLVVWGLAVVLAVTAGSFSLRSSPVPPSAASAGVADPLTTALDHLFRSTQPPSASVTTADTRGEAGRLLVSGARDGSLIPADQTYLAQIVASRTGVSQADAEARVATVTGQLKATLDRLRKVGIVLAFLTAATLLVAAATAWSAAVLGGGHRDRGTVWDGFARNQRLWFFGDVVVDKKPTRS